MKLRFPTISPLSSKDATEPSRSGLCSLSRHGLAHDGTSARNDLQVGNRPSAGRNGAGRSGKGPEGFGWGGIQERTHGSGLPQ